MSKRRQKTTKLIYTDPWRLFHGKGVDMKFTITSTGKIFEPLCKKYQELLKDFDMELKPHKLYGERYGETIININTLEDLIRLIHCVNWEIVFDGERIEIYDGYRE